MTVELKLDTPAMNHLFPEGSEACINLQQAVIENFTRRQLKGLAGAVESHLEAAKSATIQEVERKFTEALPGSFNRRKLSADFAADIEREAKRAVEKALAGAVEASLEEAMTKFGLEARLQALLDARIQKMTANAIESLLRERFEAALASIKSR